MITLLEDLIKIVYFVALSLQEKLSLYIAGLKPTKLERCHFCRLEGHKIRQIDLTKIRK